MGTGPVTFIAATAALTRNAKASTPPNMYGRGITAAGPDRDDEAINELNTAAGANDLRGTITTKSRVIGRMKLVYADLEAGYLGTSKRMKAVEKLINFHTALRNCGMTAKELKTAVGPVRVEIGGSQGRDLKDMYIKPVEMTLDRLPGLIEKGDATARNFAVYMGVKKANGQTYYDDLKRNLNLVILMPKMTEITGLFAGNDVWSAQEELGRIAVIDTYSEQNSTKRESWLLVSYMVFIAASIECYHEPGSAGLSPSVLADRCVDRANLSQLQYLKDLYKASQDPKGNITLSKDDLSWLQKNIKYLGSKIKK